MSKIPQEVAVHPVVLLSVVDHYYRLAKETSRRVIGVLLGEVIGNKVDITNCYALPFEEDPKDKKVWFVDHIYNEQMFEMHQKINYKNPPKLTNMKIYNMYCNLDLIIYK